MSITDEPKMFNVILNNKDTIISELHDKNILAIYPNWNDYAQFKIDLDDKSVQAICNRDKLFSNLETEFNLQETIYYLFRSCKMKVEDYAKFLITSLENCNDQKAIGKILQQCHHLVALVPKEKELKY